MSKNVNVNGVDYSGVSQVQLNTTEGGTALFKDVDEITTPSGSMDITENGTFDVSTYAQAVVNVAASGGSAGASGTFTGSGERRIELSLPASAEHLAVWSEQYLAGTLNVTAQAAYTFLSGFWKKNGFSIQNGVNYNSTKDNSASGYLLSALGEGDAGAYTWDDNGNFLTIAMSNAGGASKTIDGETYHWVAW